MYEIASNPNSSKAIAVLTPGIQMAFQKAKICVDYVTLPSARIQKSMKDSSIDGEFLRVKAYINQMKDHVIAVPTPVAEGKGVIVSNAAGDFSPKSLADVGDRTIGTVHAVRWHEALKKHLKTPRTSAKYGLLIKQLMANRIDGFLIDNVTLGRIIKANVISKDKIRVSPPILDLSAYVLLHRKNAKFIPDLDKAIKSVKLEGGFTLK